MQTPRLLPAFTAVLLTTFCLGCRGSHGDSQREGTATSYSAEAKPPSAALYAGAFMGKEGQQTSGTYRIERRGEAYRLVLEDGFATDEGPDLHVLLSATPAATATGNTALPEDAALVVSPLTARSGAQTYALAEEIDLSSYRSVLIHCIQYSHLYGAAPLEEAAPGP